MLGSTSSPAFSYLSNFGEGLGSFLLEPWAFFQLMSSRSKNLLRCETGEWIIIFYWGDYCQPPDHPSLMFFEVADVPLLCCPRDAVF